MKYARIYALGKERVSVIDNQLAQGKSMYHIARMVQQDWKEFQDVAEKTLVQQLNRYKADKDIPTTHKTHDPGTMVITTVIGRVDVVQKLGELEKALRERLDAALKREKGLAGMFLPGLSKEINDYRVLLLDIQKTQFDLGVDEYKGPLLAARMMTGSKVLPDGTVMHAQITEAVQVAQRAMRELNPAGFELSPNGG